jgi:hypothetical protein
MDVSLDEQAAATHARLLARERGEELPAEAYVPTTAELERAAAFARKAPQWGEVRTVPVGVVVARSRGTSRESRPQAGRVTRSSSSSRDGPSRPSDEPPRLELDGRRLRELAALAARQLSRCIIHERRRSGTRKATA